MSDRPPFPFAGEAASLAAAICWAVGMCLFARFGTHLSAQNLNLLKGFFGALFLLVLLAGTELVVPDTTVAGQLALSGLVGIALGDTFLLAALSRIGAQGTAAGMCLSAPMTAILAWIFLGEALSSREWLGLFVTVAAVGMVLGRARAPLPSGAAPDARRLGVLFAILSPLSHATGMVLGRDAMHGTEILLATLIRIAAALAVLAILGTASGSIRALRATFLTPRQGLAVVMAGVVGTGLGIACLTMGMKYAKAGVTATLTATFPIWVIPLAWVFLGEPVRWQGALATVLAVLGVTLMF